MSLTVLVLHPVTREAVDEVPYLPVGVETARRDLWSHPVVRDLGARFLPQLAAGDLFVEPDELDAFEAECALLRSNVGAVAAATGYGLRGGLIPGARHTIFLGPYEGILADPQVRETEVGRILIGRYLEHLLRASAVARRVGGTVYVG